MMILKVLDGPGNHLIVYICEGTFRGDLTGANPTDRGKLGTKRHILTDQKGIPLSVSITGANTHDIKAAIDTLDYVIVKRPSYEQNLCLDKGYDFPEIEKEITKRKYIPHIYVIEAKNPLQS